MLFLAGQVIEADYSREAEAAADAYAADMLLGADLPPAADVARVRMPLGVEVNVVPARGEVDPLPHEEARPCVEREVERADQVVGERVPERGVQVGGRKQ